MVSADSRRVSRAPRYSGTGFESGWFSLTRLSRSMAPLSSGVQLTTGLVTLLLPALQPLSHPIRNQVGRNRFDHCLSEAPTRHSIGRAHARELRIEWLTWLPMGCERFGLFRF